MGLNVQTRRILLGDMQQESHSFNPQVMTGASFTTVEDEACIGHYRGTNTVAGGVVDAAESAGVDITFPIGMSGTSGGRVDHQFYLRFRSTMVAAAKAGEFDAILLSLHGAMMTTELDDPEADLIKALREATGPKTPIVAGFDLHAHVTQETISNCDFLTAYRTNPHGDMGITGERMFAKAMDIVSGEFDPVCAFLHFPMLTLGNDRTDQEPLLSILDRARAAEASARVVDVSIFTVQQFLNIPNMGQTILVYGNGEHDDAMALAEKIGSDIWAARGSLSEVFADVDEQIERANTPGQTRPLILGDQGDRVAAGSPGDSPFILSRVLNIGAQLHAAIPITDPSAVDKLRGEEAGSTVTIAVGGAMSGDYYNPFMLTGTLVRHSENERYTFRGPMAEGIEGNTGPFAVVKVNDVQVLLTTYPSAYIDPNNFVAMGVDLDRQDIVVTRSGYHYTLNFDGVGDCVVVGTPGMTSYNVRDLPFTVARPFYPMDDIEYVPQRAVRRRGAQTERLDS